VTPLLEKNFRHLQNATNSLLKEVSSISSSTYHYKAAENKWSISQIMTHLLTAEKLSIGYMQKKIRSIETLEDVGISAVMRFMILRVSQYVPLRYKAPRVVLENTPSALSFGDLVRQWEQQRSELKELLENISPDHVHKAIYKHPYAGRLSAVHALGFLKDHIMHHRPQIMHIVSLQKKSSMAGSNRDITH
jgi:hypothetical protein